MAKVVGEVLGAEGSFLVGNWKWRKWGFLIFFIIHRSEKRVESSLAQRWNAFLGIPAIARCCTPPLLLRDDG